MKLDYLKEKKEQVSVVLLAASALMAVLLLIKVVGFFVISARAENLVKKAIEQNNADANDTGKYFAESKKLADGLKKENLFVPPPPKQHPVKEVWGIFGDQVLIKDKWYNVGDMVGNAKILAIGPTSAKIEWDGKEKVFLPIDSAGPKVASGSKSGRPAAGGSRSGRTPAKAGGPGGERPDMVVVQSGEGPPPGREGRRGPGGFPGEGGPGMRGGFDRMRERWQNMPEEERDRLREEMQERRERYMSMSEEEREKFRAEMRERFGGGRPGGRPGGSRDQDGGRGRGSGGRR
jgi:hypothetical protein